jgi:hypothetical protein
MPDTFFCCPADAVFNNEKTFDARLDEMMLSLKLYQQRDHQANKVPTLYDLIFYLSNVTSATKPPPNVKALLRQIVKDKYRGYRQQEISSRYTETDASTLAFFVRQGLLPKGLTFFVAVVYSMLYRSGRGQGVMKIVRMGGIPERRVPTLFYSDEFAFRIREVLERCRWKCAFVILQDYGYYPPQRQLPRYFENLSQNISCRMSSKDGGGADCPCCCPRYAPSRNTQNAPVCDDCGHVHNPIVSYQGNPTL